MIHDIPNTSMHGMKYGHTINAYYITMHCRIWIEQVKNPKKLTKLTDR